jgi:hypothetical protein
MRDRPALVARRHAGGHVRIISTARKADLFAPIVSCPGAPIVSCPGLARVSTTFARIIEDVGGRAKPHTHQDSENGHSFFPVIALPRLDWGIDRATQSGTALYPPRPLRAQSSRHHRTGPGSPVDPPIKSGEGYDGKKQSRFPLRPYRNAYGAKTDHDTNSGRSTCWVDEPFA